MADICSARKGSPVGYSGDDKWTQRDDKSRQRKTNRWFHSTSSIHSVVLKEPVILASGVV
jgi:hypothetical protein